MFVVFEENSQFKAEKILTEADTTLQVESASGKRSKIKRNNVLFTFNDREPEGMVQEAQVIAQDIDVQAKSKPEKSSDVGVAPIEQ